MEKFEKDKTYSYKGLYNISSVSFYEYPVYCINENVGRVMTSIEGGFLVSCKDCYPTLPQSNQPDISFVLYSNKYADIYRITLPTFEEYLLDLTSDGYRLSFDSKEFDWARAFKYKEDMKRNELIELNKLARKLLTLSFIGYDKIICLLETGKELSLRKSLENQQGYYLLYEVETFQDLGFEYLKNTYNFKEDDTVLEMIDFERMGEWVYRKESGAFCSMGYIGRV